MSIMPLTPEQVATIGFLLGPVARTIYDYLWAVYDDPDLIFDKRYLITLAASAGISVIAGMFFVMGFLQNLPQGSQTYIFFASFSQGFVLNHVINRPLDSRRNGEEHNEPE